MAIGPRLTATIAVLVMVGLSVVPPDRAAADTIAPPQLPPSVGNVSSCPEANPYVEATNSRLTEQTRDVEATAEAFLSLGRATLSCASRLRRTSPDDVPQAWISAGLSLSTAADLYGYLSKSSASGAANYGDLFVSTARIAFVVLNAAKKDSNDVNVLETTTNAIAKIVAMIDRYAPNRMDEVTGADTSSPP